MLRITRRLWAVLTDRDAHRLELLDANVVNVHPEIEQDYAVLVFHVRHPELSESFHISVRSGWDDRIREFAAVLDAQVEEHC